MIKLEDLSQQKKFIKDNWNISSGAKIAEMLERYWKNSANKRNEDAQEKNFKTAQEIFDVKEV